MYCNKEGTALRESTSGNHFTPPQVNTGHFIDHCCCLFCVMMLLSL